MKKKMKGKTTTIRRIISNFNPVKIEIQKEIPEDWKTKPYTEIVHKLVGRQNIFVKITRPTKEKLFVNIVSNCLTRIGARVFVKNQISCVLYMENNILKVKSSTDFIWYKKEILEAFGIRWAEELDSNLSYYLAKPAILKAVLTGRVYNEETFFKKVMSTCFSIRDIEWREIKEFCKNCSCGYVRMKLADLQDFTKNFRNSIRVYNRLCKEKDYSGLQLLADTLQNAVILNEKIDFNWSMKRLNAEHHRMVQEINKFDVESKSDKPLYEETIEEDDIRLLNSEKDVFLEGINMHHCVYTNYFKRISNGLYLAFHMKAPEDCTIGVSVNDLGEPLFNQAYGFRNTPIQKPTKILIDAFLERHFQKMRNLALERRTAKLGRQIDATHLPF